METRLDLFSSHDRAASGGEPIVLEALEPRSLLGADPYPALTDLTSVNDTVLRIDTNLGNVDIELFDTGPNPAPLTATSFLGYVRRGDYDRSFFHRYATLTGGIPFVLQGGGFRFIDGTGLSTIPTLPPILNEFSALRSNIVRTIAMAKLGQGPDPVNSATDQFFFNLGDNSANLDHQNGGFTVFGRVANDRSWNVVLAITALNTRNLNSQLDPDAFDTVPVTTTAPNPTVSESILVIVNDIEVIKEKNVQEFYKDVLYYPEGFAGSTINEFLPIQNTNDHTVIYQVIARAEIPQGTAANGFTWFRDKVISPVGGLTIGPTSRGGITISHFGAGGQPSADDLVPQGVPYSIEIRATDTLFANMSRYDFGTSTGEAFTRTTSTTWGFADLYKLTGAGGVSDFLVWENPNNQDATVTITYYFQNLAPFSAVVTTRMFRRGGVNLNQVGSIPGNTAFSVQVSSTQPLIAALSHFDSRAAGDPLGSAELGVSGSGSRFGVIPFGNVGPGATGIPNQESISVLNTGTSQSVVVNFTLSFSIPGLQPLSLPASLIVAPQRRGTFDFSGVAQLADGRRYSIRYDILPGSAQVYAGWVHKQSFPGISNADDIANPVGVVAATKWEFAEGFMDPARAGRDVFENISIYNPHILAFGATVTPANVTIRLLYGDSFVLSLPEVQIAAGGRIDLDLHAIQAVLNQGTQNQRYFYSIEVVSDVVVVAQMRHFDLTLGGASPSGGFATLGAPSGSITRLDSLT